ncbi:MAG: glycoside hydrolase [Betaproteobacteria bacterium HGW-Betaproteobacteria-7]|jgi:glycosyltransferase involved in cell wall biosynthesis|nr:MAG: glycoside hydrolase [Betaproteobacteria bacterium HGW-Betaproteobacteria-7]
MALEIALVSETYPPEVNGVAMTVGRLVSGLRELGHRVEVIRPRQTLGDAGGDDDRTVAALPLPGYYGLRFGLPAGGMLTRRWRLRRPDLVHVVTEGPLGWSAVSAARRLGIPVTSGFHTNFDRYSAYYGVGWLRPLVAAYLRILHRRTLLTMVPTATLAADLAGSGIGGVRVVGRGVDTGLYDPARRSANLRASWGVSAGQPACLYVGRLAPEKNPQLVLAAFAAIRQRHPGARLIWVGDGPAAEGLASAHPEHHFAGMRTGVDLAMHYASADLFLFPSLTETYGNVVAEAMASGLPVVAYRSAAAAELIDHRHNGVVAPPGDELAYIEAATWLLAEPERRRQVGEMARASMLTRRWSDIVERFASVVGEAIEINARSSSGSAPQPAHHG